MLLTKAIRRTLPLIKSQENVKDPIVHVKFFTPDSNITWYVTEGEPIVKEGIEVDFHFYGRCHGQYKEWGYSSLRELERSKGPFGFKIERDRYFSPGPMSEVEGK